MPRKLPPLNAIRAIEASARHGGFVAAARELGVTPAAVSLQIRKLEDFYAAVVAHDCAEILMYSPINIRHAFDYTNMQIWSSREATRYAMLFGEGPAVMHEYKGAGHMVKNGAGVDEVRNATTWLWMISDSAVEERAKVWAAEIADLMREHGGATGGLRPTSSTRSACARSRRSGSRSWTGRRSPRRRAASSPPTRSSR